jgi:hypothetical protein
MASQYEEPSRSAPDDNAGAAARYNTAAPPDEVAATAKHN